MSSESVQKRIELLLKEVAEAVAESNWAVVINRAQNVLRMESENKDALAYMDAAEQALGLFPYDTFP
ncbi:MAG: hypothetical protein ACE10C_04965 [Candidatus Binatia bacterium]